MAWYSGMRVAMVDIIEPLFIRLGVQKIPYWTNIRGVLAGIEIGSPFAPLQAVIRAIGQSMQGSASAKLVWAYVAYDLMEGVVNFQATITNWLEERAKDIWDKHSGDLGNYLIESGALFMTEYVAEETRRRTGVELRLHLALPMNAAQIEIIGGDVGAWLAELTNAKIGTSFVNLYPPENLKNELKAQVMAEITSGTRKIFTQADIDGIVQTLRASKAADLVQQFGVTNAIAQGMGLPVVPENLQMETKAARRLVQNRERQRKFRLSHELIYTGYKPKNTPNP